MSSLSNDFLPWVWVGLNPTWADWGILAGSFGWFGMWFLLFKSVLKNAKGELVEQKWADALKDWGTYGAAKEDQRAKPCEGAAAGGYFRTARRGYLVIFQIGFRRPILI